jgi:hypothetical protein
MDAQQNWELMLKPMPSSENSENGFSPTILRRSYGESGLGLGLGRIVSRVMGVILTGNE